MIDDSTRTDIRTEWDLGPWPPQGDVTPRGRQGVSLRIELERPLLDNEMAALARVHAAIEVLAGLIQERHPTGFVVMPPGMVWTERGWSEVGGG